MEPTNETLSELYTGTACTLDGKVKGEWSWQAVALALTTKKGKFRM